MTTITHTYIRTYIHKHNYNNEYLHTHTDVSSDTYIYIQRSAKVGIQL